MSRLFVGQGSLHVLTAIVAGEACGDPVPSPGDVLLFHGLNPERDQSEAWARVLERAVRSYGDWRGVIFLEPERIDAWTRAAAERGWRAVAAELRAAIGADRFDEVYIQRNPDFINRLIVSAYAGARTTCYGDGLGVNYSERYWSAEVAPEPPAPADPGPAPAPAAPRAPWPRRASGRLRRIGAELLRPRPPEAEPPAARFDRHCLLLPNRFDDRVEDPVVPDPERLRRRIDALVPLLAEAGEARSAAAELARRLAGADEALVLLPSCFAEAGRIEPAAEVEGYAEVIEELAPLPGAAIVLKPHPRDQRAKTEALVARLGRGDRRVIVLDDPASRYLPFEVTLRLALSGPDLPPRRFVTFSSACLALELLFGERTIVGFGEERVRRLFRPEYVERRLVHERDLRLAVEHVRAMRAASPK